MLTSIAVIVAIHNRRDLTVRCIRSLSRSLKLAPTRAELFIFDDGSTDGSALAAAESTEIPVHVIQGDGMQYWAASMARAEVVASATDPDYILWLNDDVEMDLNAISYLLDQSKNESDAVLVGAMRDPDLDVISYSGYRRSGAHPLGLTMLSTTLVNQPLDAFHGNLVLVPRAASKRVGPIDGGFSHGMADIDFGLRCRKAGVRVLLSRTSLGECKMNRPVASGMILKDWRAFIGLKGGGNPGGMIRLLRKNSLVWPVFVVSTYGLWWVRALGRYATRSRKVFYA